jgi:pimeloyl-ACP methyl ester carboxylesterase
VSTFGLVHGALCGAWTWERLRPQLERCGHSVTAMDLPCEDPTAGAARYAEVVCKALEGAGEDVIVVGHSLGGLTIPIVAAARPVRRLVFLTAFIPQPGRTFKEQYGEEEGMFPLLPESLWPITDEEGMTTWPAERVIPALMPDCPPEAAAAAAARLRPQSSAPHTERCLLSAWPEVPSSYILCLEDTQVGAEWARRAAKQRLGTVAVELPGGHMPMLARPVELAEALDRIARTA